MFFSLFLSKFSLCWFLLTLTEISYIYSQQDSLLFCDRIDQEWEQKKNEILGKPLKETKKP